MNIDDLYEELKAALQTVIINNGLSGEPLSVRCRALSAEEAIGIPREKDYPIIKGKEVMVEAVFRDGRGQAFSDNFENATYTVENLLDLDTDSTRKRASFISGLNAVYRHLGLCGKTIHCRDEEPGTCAADLIHLFSPSQKVLLIGFQPRFLEMLAVNSSLRVIDLDAGNIGKSVSGIVVEPPDMTMDAIRWCDAIFATGSTLVNGTIGAFLNCGKPATFYGVTISAPAKILNLNSYCRYGH
jgi:uncharacterized protein (DUF4213/DUF364 family)